MTTLAWFLIAEWRNLGDRFSGQHAEFHATDWLTFASIVAGVAAIVWLMVTIHRRQLSRATSNRSCHLFADLCAAHRLRFGDRRILKALAHELELDTPAELFLRPECFETENLPAAVRRYEIQYELLSGKLFAGLEEPAPKSAGGKGAARPAPMILPLPAASWQEEPAADAP